MSVIKKMDLEPFKDSMGLIKNGFSSSNFYIIKSREEIRCFYNTDKDTNYIEISVWDLISRLDIKDRITVHNDFYYKFKYIQSILLEYEIQEFRFWIPNKFAPLIIQAQDWYYYVAPKEVKEGI